MRRLGAAAAVALALLLPACAGTDRPEGVVERWLISLNQGAAGRPGQYAPNAVSRSILSGWERCDPGALDVVEVGKGRQFVTDRPELRTTGAAVPYRIEYTTDLDVACDDPAAQHSGTDGIAFLLRLHGEWRIWKLAPRASRGGGENAFADLRVPSEGGPELASATAGEWLAGVGVGVAFALIVIALMRLAPRPADLPRRE